MKYHTINELDHFCFKEAYIAQICAVSGMFEIVFDNVTILPENSCNRDIREMRANELVLKISEPKIEALVEDCLLYTSGKRQNPIREHGQIIPGL